MSLDTSEFLEALMEESFEALDAMEVSLLELDHGGDDAELINTIFRGAHSIKGGCGMLGLDEIASFTHVIETLLDKVRDGEIGVDMPLTGLLLECVDAVRGMFDALSNDESSDQALIDSLVARLNAALEGRKDEIAGTPPAAVAAPEPTPEPEPEPQPEPQPVATEPAPRVETAIEAAVPQTPVVTPAPVMGAMQDWIVTLVPPGNLLDSNDDIAARFESLSELGDAVVLGQTAALPALNQIDPTHCYLSWQVNLASAAGADSILAAVGEAFPRWQIQVVAESSGQITAEDSREFSQLMDVLKGDNNSPVVTEPVSASPEPVVATVAETPVPVAADNTTFEIPVQAPVETVASAALAPEPAVTVTADVASIEAPAPEPVDPPAPAVAAAASEQSPTPAKPESVARSEPAPESKPEAAPAAPAKARQPAKAKTKPAAKSAAKDRKQTDTGSIRVSTQKIDTLINMAGELVITQAMLTQQGEKLMESGLGNLENLWDGLGQLERNLRELQDAVMSIRMLPISFAFSRFPRMIRDLNARIGKDVRLETSGEQTELDKTVMEKIGDPLVHLVRNSFDHGIELPEDRRAAGKPEQGVIELNAYHQGGNIVIEVVDDGKGLDREKIVAKARERGLLGPEEEIADEKALELIFEPGFSTVEQVSDLSGRGVGMDVVRRNIRELGGNIELHSEVGVGTKFTIRLPLTLAILDGQLVYVGGETFVIPLLSIIESIQIDKQSLSTVAGSRQLYQLRDEYIPVVSLYELFGLSRSDETVDHDLLVVIEGDGKKIGLRVDDLLGQQQAFIKSLETNYKQVPGVSGATILGDGTVSLILDAGAIVRLSGCAD